MYIQESFHYAEKSKQSNAGILKSLLILLICNIDIVNFEEVCKFLQVFKLSFSPEYGSKLKEVYIMVKHLPKIIGNDDDSKCCSRKIIGNDDDIKCCSCKWFSFCRNNWQNVFLISLHRSLSSIS